MVDAVAAVPGAVFSVTLVLGVISVIHLAATHRIVAGVLQVGTLPCIVIDVSHAVI
jgi:hypothetical protein